MPADKKQKNTHQQVGRHHQYQRAILCAQPAQPLQGALSVRTDRMPAEKSSNFRGEILGCPIPLIPLKGQRLEARRR